MKMNEKRYRKTPPYMTQSGVQIGLLYQEPFEVRIDKDAYKLQKAILSNRYKVSYREPIHYGDLIVGVVSVVLLIALIVMVVNHVV